MRERRRGLFIMSVETATTNAQSSETRLDVSVTLGDAALIGILAEMLNCVMTYEHLSFRLLDESDLSKLVAAWSSRAPKIPRVLWP